MKNKAIFLDRDGVLNAITILDGVPQSPKSLSDFAIISGVKSALNKLKAAGYFLIVVTNQPDVARGKMQKAVIDAMHAYLKKELPIDAVYVCFHDDLDACDCRKPKPGLIINAAALHDILLEESYVIGDRWKDVLAGKAANCKTIFIDYGYRETEKNVVTADYCIHSIQEAVEIVLHTQRN